MHESGLAHLGSGVLHCSKLTFGRASALMIARWLPFQHDASSRTPLGHGLSQVFEAAIAVSRPSPASPRARRALLWSAGAVPRIALNETSHDQGRHRRARDAGVLPIRVAGDAEQQQCARGCSALGPLPYATP